MLVARPARIGSWSFVIEDEADRAVAEVDLKTLTDAGALRLGDVPFAFSKAGWLSKRFALTFEGVEVATAERSGWLGFTYDVQIRPGLLGTPEAVRLRLEASLGQRRIRVRLGDREVGEIRRRGVFTRRAEIEVSDALPLGVQAFLLALVLVEWRRAARSSA